ncbi:MAG: hypothetical protein ACAH12_02085 [Methylophilaceae bacterium]
MKQSAIRLAVLSALGLIPVHAMADWVNLPAVGSSPSTAYVTCNPTGNFGSGDSTPPSTLTDACAIFPATRNSSPESGYTLYASQIGRNVNLSNSYTSSSTITVATMDEAVWKNSGTGTLESCIYGNRFTMIDVDYWKGAGHTGKQTLEINGFARAGFASFTNVAAAYFYSSVSDESVFRVGRTYTSVQHRASLANEDNPATGYVALPPTSGATSGAAISGVATYDNPLLTPTTAQQSAAFAANWVEFTSDNNFADEDGSSLKDSSQLYVKVTGTGACPNLSGGGLTAGAYSFRQTGQEEAPLFEFNMSGYIPSAGSVTIP